MIAHLTGKIIARDEDSIVVDVAGVGYGVHISAHTHEKVATVNDISLFVYTHVREQEITLYGFMAQEEKELFVALLTISGVGPKAAMNILSIAPPQTILTAIAHSDASLLTKVSGIGKKTAERIVLELHNKVQKLRENMPQDSDTHSTDDIDAIDALVGLGYSVAEARDALRAVSSDLPPTATMTDRIRAALKYAGQKK